MSHSTDPLKAIKHKHEVQEVLKFGLNEMYAGSVPDYTIIPFIRLAKGWNIHFFFGGFGPIRKTLKQFSNKNALGEIVDKFAQTTKSGNRPH